MRYLPRNIKIKEVSQTLRKNMTKEEKHLWYDFLRTYPVQFYRQKIIGNYIIDFYCPSAKLAVEIDGYHHLDESKVNKDIKRTEYLSEFEITVIRFWNFEIHKSFDYVCNTIDAMVKNLTGQAEPEFL